MKEHDNQENDFSGLIKHERKDVFTGLIPVIFSGLFVTFIYIMTGYTFMLVLAVIPGLFLLYFILRLIRFLRILNLIRHGTESIGEVIAAVKKTKFVSSDDKSNYAITVSFYNSYNLKINANTPPLYGKDAASYYQEKGTVAIKSKGNSVIIAEKIPPENLLENSFSKAEPKPDYPENLFSVMKKNKAAAANGEEQKIIEENENYKTVLAGMDNTADKLIFLFRQKHRRYIDILDDKDDVANEYFELEPDKYDFEKENIYNKALEEVQKIDDAGIDALKFEEKNRLVRFMCSLINPLHYAGILQKIIETTNESSLNREETEDLTGFKNFVSAYNKYLILNLTEKRNFLEDNKSLFDIYYRELADNLLDEEDELLSQ